MKIPAASLELDMSLALQASPGKLGVMKWKGFTKKTERRQNPLQNRKNPNKQTKNPEEKLYVFTAWSLKL